MNYMQVILRNPSSHIILILIEIDFIKLRSPCPTKTHLRLLLEIDRKSTNQYNSTLIFLDLLIESNLCQQAKTCSNNQAT